MLRFVELTKRNIEVKVVSFDSVRSLPKVIRHIYFFWKVYKESKNYDFVYAQDPVSVGLPALLASRLAGKKFGVRIAGDYAWEQSVQRFGVSDSIDEFQTKKYSIFTEVLRFIQIKLASSVVFLFTPIDYFRVLFFICILIFILKLIYTAFIFNKFFIIKLTLNSKFFL